MVWNLTNVNTSIQAVIAPEPVSEGAATTTVSIDKNTETIFTSDPELGSKSTAVGTANAGMFWTSYSSSSGLSVTGTPSVSVWPAPWGNSSIWKTPTITAQSSLTSFTNQGSLKGMPQSMMFWIFICYYVIENLQHR